MSVALYLIDVVETVLPRYGSWWGPAASVLDTARALPGYRRGMAHGDGPSLPTTPYLVEADDFAALDAVRGVVRLGPAAKSQAALMAALDALPASDWTTATKDTLVTKAGRIGVPLDDLDARSQGALVRRLSQRVEPAITDDAFDRVVVDPKQTITDDFNRAALGANWSSLAGVWAITASTYAAPTGIYVAEAACVRTETSFPDDHYAQNDTEHTSVPDKAFGGVAVRITDASNFYRCSVNVNLIQIYKRVAGSATYLADAVAVLAADTLYTIKLSATGTGLAGFQNGVQKLTATDSALATGKPGMWQVSGDHFARHDDFECTDAVSAVTTGAGFWLQRMRRRIEDDD